MTPIADPERYADAVMTDRELVAVLESNRHRSPSVVAECEETTSTTRRYEFRARIRPHTPAARRDKAAWYAEQIATTKARITRAETTAALPPLDDLAHTNWKQREAAVTKSLDRERARAHAQAELAAARSRLAWLEARA